MAIQHLAPQQQQPLQVQQLPYSQQQFMAQPQQGWAQPQYQAQQLPNIPFMHKAQQQQQMTAHQF